MIVEIKPFSFLREYIPVSHMRINGDRWDLQQGTTVGQALKMLNLPDGEPFILLLNDRLTNRDRVLEEGDILQIIPTVCGG